MKKAFFAAAIYAILFFLLSAESLNAQVWAAVKRGDKWFYIDKTGKITINALFDEAGERFVNGLAPVKQKGKWGYINTGGKMVLKPKYLQANCFNNGLALVQMVQKKDTGWYFIRANGEIFKKLEVTEIEIDTFTDGIYLVEMPAGKAYILPSGKMLYAPKGLTEIYPFYNGLARVRKGTKYGYLDTSGNLKIDYTYYAATNFREGKACVLHNDYYILIDTAGKKLQTLKFMDDVAEFTNGIAAVRMDGKYQVYNYIKDTAIETELVYSARWLNFLTYPFSSGSARFWAHQSGSPLQYNFIDINGKIQNNYYDYASDYHEGMAAVRSNNHYGFLDARGKLVIEHLYDEVKPFYRIR